MADNETSKKFDIKEGMMNVELPREGCNIINSATTFYNYSTDSKTRDTYVIYDGKAIKQSSSYNQYGYTYTGECLDTGDLVYKPEVKDFWMPHMAIGVFLIIVIMIFKLLRGKS